MGGRLAERLIAGLGYAYIRGLGLTMKLEYRNREALAAVRGEGGQYVLAFWHSRFVMMPYGCLDRRLVAMVSEHRDARLLGAVLGHFGYVLAHGSSTRGGSAALRQVLRRVREGYDVGMTPDGPRGPRRRAKPGVVATARMSGLPIVPAAFSARPARRLGSWDRTLVPYPFARGLFIYGDPVRVARHADGAEQERARREVERQLDRLTDEADRAVGLVEEAARPPAESGWDDRGS